MQYYLERADYYSQTFTNISAGLRFCQDLFDAFVSSLARLQGQSPTITLHLIIDSCLLRLVSTTCCSLNGKLIPEVLPEQAFNDQEAC